MSDTEHDGKSDIEREIERMGFSIYVKSKDGIPFGAYVVRGQYRSAEAQSWQKLRDILQADGEWKDK